MSDKMIEELELSVVFNHDGTIRCVYLDDHRICGGKPYASEGLRFKDFKVRASAIVDIARRHEATDPQGAKPAEEGLREDKAGKVFDRFDEWYTAMQESSSDWGPGELSDHWLLFDDIIFELKRILHPAKAEEPMLKTPPEFEKVFRENVEKIYATGSKQINIEEPLAVLADRKGWPRVHINEFRGKWYLSLWQYNNENPATKFPFEGDTYPACEAKARAFLMGLPDREGE